MSKHQRLGDAYTNSGYYNYWKRLLTFVNLTTSNSFWNNTELMYHRKGMSRNLELELFTLENGPPLR